MCAYFFISIMMSIAILSIPVDCRGLDPDEVLVIANRNAAKSVGLAKYYMKKRGIPEKNIIMLWVTDKETCSRYVYEKKIAPPLRRYLEQMPKPLRIRCLLLMYGMPLKIAPSEPDLKEKKEIKILRQEQKKLVQKLDRLNNIESEEYKRRKNALDEIKKRISELSKAGKAKTASLDSEIALVLEKDYELSGWIPNPYYLGNKNKKSMVTRDKVLMVSRLDGPSEKIVKRIINDSISAEEKGLKGKAYFDARWKNSGNKKKSGYAFYDQSIHNGADRVEKSALMLVKIDDAEQLYQPGDCPDAALYCGWYSLARYVDAFDWVPGAVGYHIASSECATLKKKDSRVWCKMMLEDGIAATLGPVGEPYVRAFPVPEIFFGFLIDGYMGLAECYFVSIPYLSWKMVLIGDPLYRPFKNRSAGKF